MNNDAFNQKEYGIKVCYRKEDSEIIDYVSTAIDVLKTEANAIIKMSTMIDDIFNKVISLILKSKGKLIVSGIGKSGHIGAKIFSTLNSTGTTSFFLHPAEAFHGDLGMVAPEDVFLILSYSGETEEIVRLIPYLKKNGNVLISITGNKESSLARSSDLHIDIGRCDEACPLKLAPTTSTTVMLSLGDAIAVALMKAKKFKKENFAKFHPGGSLGRKLLGTVSDFSKPATVIGVNDSAKDLISKLATDKNGIICVLEEGVLAGVITDGDLKRALTIYGVDDFIRKSPRDIMSKKPKIVCRSMNCGEADELMVKLKINSLVVNMDNGCFSVYHNLNRG